MFKFKLNIEVAIKRPKVGFNSNKTKKKLGGYLTIARLLSSLLILIVRFISKLKSIASPSRFFWRALHCNIVATNSLCVLA